METAAKRMIDYSVDTMEYNVAAADYENAEAEYDDAMEEVAEIEDMLMEQKQEDEYKAQMAG